MTKILNIFTNEIICEDESLSIKDLAVKNKYDLQDADLRGANLQDADLQDANLQDADLRFANLQDADLRGANLQDADLQDANLQDAGFRFANLRGANLRGANLGGATLKDYKIITFKQINEIGNNKKQLSCFYLENESFYFIAGCFFGSEEELKSKVIEKYGNDCEYLDAIEFLKTLCKKYK
jgi:uncharacterized protein YjbI with pentapeptide repeats